MSNLRLDTGGLWVAKQGAGKGTAASSPRKKLSVVSGGISPKTEQAMTRYLDGKRFGKKISFKKNTSIASGDLQILATPEELHYLLSTIFTNDAVVSGPPHEHTATSDADTSAWLTFWQRVGTGNIKEANKFVDCKVVGIEIEGSASADTPVLVKLEVVGLSVETAQSADPTPSETTTSEPYVWTDITGSITADGDTLQGISQLNLSIQTGEELFFGDSQTAHDVVAGQPNLEATFTTLVDEQGHDLYKKLIYGTSSPSTGDGISGDDTTGSLTWTWSYGTSTALREATFTLPNCTFSTDSELVPNPEGGASELACNAVAQTDTNGDPALTVVSKNADGSAY